MEEVLDKNLREALEHLAHFPPVKTEEIQTIPRNQPRDSSNNPVARGKARFTDQKTSKTSDIATRERAGDGDVYVYDKVITSYKSRIATQVQDLLSHARARIVQEHKFSREGFEQLCLESDLYPEQRKDEARLYALAMYHGLKDRLPETIYLLAPQVENLVRLHLQEKKGESLGGSNLNRFMNNKKNYSHLVKIFGEDLFWTIRFIYCRHSDHDINLRNKVAHGLMTFDDCIDPTVLYAWWIGLRMMLVPLPWEKDQWIG